MSNPLSPATLQAVLKDVLPRETTLPNTTSVIAGLAHSIHTSLGFRLVKPKAEVEQTGEGTPSSSSNTKHRLPPSWFQRSSEEESFAISYRHEQSSLLFEIRVHRLGSRTMVNAVAVEDNKTATLDVVTSDYLSGSALPKKLSEGATATTETETETATEPLTTTFNSPHRLDDFITLYKIQIIQKLIPGLVKPGYTEEQESTGGGGGPGPGPSTSSSTGQYPSRPDNTRPERTHPPRFPSAGQGGGNNPLEIGRSDLDPLGGAVGRLPGAGGDGMLVGPGHPLFSREREQNDPLRIPGTDGNGNRGPWGGDGYLPPLGAPPGARFDPVAPFGPGGGGAPGFGQGPQRRDWGDEMPPPGFDNEMGGNVRFNPLNPGGQGGGFGGGFGGPPRGGGMGGGFGNMFM